MSADTLAVISYVAFACSFLFLLLAIILYVRLDIKSIIDDLSGKRAARQIQAFREQNASQRKDAGIMLGRTGEQKSENIAISETIKLDAEKASDESEETIRLYQETVLLTAEETEPSKDEQDDGCKLILNEIVIHTGERI